MVTRNPRKVACARLVGCLQSSVKLGAARLVRLSHLRVPKSSKRYARSAPPDLPRVRCCLRACWPCGARADARCAPGRRHDCAACRGVCTNAHRHHHLRLHRALVRSSERPGRGLASPHLRAAHSRLHRARRQSAVSALPTMTLAGDISPVFLASATGSLVFVLAVVAVVVINFGIMKK